LNLKPNDIMIMQRDHGYLRRITSVAQQSNAITVQTSDASLTDAVERGSFSLSGTLGPDNVQSMSKVLEGVTLKKNVLHPDALLIEIPDVVLYERSGSQIKANGSLEIAPSFDFSMRVESSKPLQLAFTLTVQETADLSVTADIDFLQISEEKRIATITFGTIIGTIGTVPVVVTPKLSVYVGIDGNASASFSTGVTQQCTFSAGVRYENSTWANSHSLTNDFSSTPPTLTASLEAKAYVEARLELLFYGVLAPHASADGYLRITADPSVTPWWSLYGGLGVGAGVSVQILGRTIVGYSVPDVIAYQRLLVSATASDVWTRKADFGGTPRFEAIAFSIGGRGYVGLGHYDYDYGNYLRDFWAYDPSSNTWTQEANFGGTARYGAVGFCIGNKGYVGTGVDSLRRRDFWEYDPPSNAWTQKANFGGVGRHQAVGFSIGNRGYIGNGSDTGWREFWEYDPSGNIWTQKADCPIQRTVAVAFSIRNRGYMGTGSNGSSGTRDFWEYDPSANIWAQKTDFGGTARVFAVGFSIGNKGYVGMGGDGSTLYRDFWEYDPLSDSWTRKADFAGPLRTGAVGFSIANRGFTGLGGYGLSLYEDFWEYIP
jgi:N-acetylneuraminic acid mutarotase